VKTQDQEKIRYSIERISLWMNAHGAPLLVDNLAPGANAERLAAAEAEFGVALPAELGALWSVHDGQCEAGNGFIESYDLLSIDTALGERESVLLSVELGRDSTRNELTGTTEELDSDHWLPFAARDSDSLVVHALTGRVFRCDHDSQPTLLAPSLADWFQRYAERVEAGDYTVEQGFGDYYLALRDRRAERLQQEREQRALEQQKMRRETPLLQQFRKALESKRDDRCIEVLKDALASDDTDTFNAAVALLFADDSDARLIASSLRPLLNAVTLTPDQWFEVAVGGALLENNAIRDLAVSRAQGFSAARLQKLEASIAGVPAEDRDSLETLVEKLRAK